MTPYETFILSLPVRHKSRRRVRSRTVENHLTPLDYRTGLIRAKQTPRRAAGFCVLGGSNLLNKNNIVPKKLLESVYFSI